MCRPRVDCWNRCSLRSPHGGVQPAELCAREGRDASLTRSRSGLSRNNPDRNRNSNHPAESGRAVQSPVPNSAVARRRKSTTINHPARLCRRAGASLPRAGGARPAAGALARRRAPCPDRRGGGTSGGTTNRRELPHPAAQTRAHRLRRSPDDQTTARTTDGPARDAALDTSRAARYVSTRNHRVLILL